MGVQRFPPNPDAVWMYEKGGLSCREIAPMFGVSESTVKRWMRSAGVIRTEASKQGRPPEDECKYGHDLSKWRRRDRSGNPYCLLCKQARGRISWEKRKMKKKPEPKKPVKYGKVSESFSEPAPIEPGACPTCGATPPCRPHKGAQK